MVIEKSTKKIRADIGKSSEAGNTRRAELSAIAKGHINKENEEEEEIYQSGRY